ncbi:hypothetical protein CDL12_00528 [Handroanthus impetiginosus]|uniref:TF-B3 domain-containing protein n=1 Tax=Handroanthus impetiginosus TaxID=429701 RepID=A0A2G9IAD4_9LAMI|nr:hypothetical protein CDL12_00528 [Handroanthus impetiginosus]
MDSRPGFFKRISTSENLKIPRAFGSQMQEVLANSVILRDRYKNMWRMEVARVGDHDWYFDEGWAKFYEENSLEPGNFLVFEYRDRNLFDFKLLGSDGCEKKGVGVLKFSFNEERNGDGDDNDNDSDDDDDENDDDESEEEQDEEEEQINTSITFGSGIIPSKRRYRKRNICCDCYGADIFESGLVPRPKHPYFVTRSRTSRKNELHIPKKVIVDYHLEIPKNLFLIDEKGRKWKTKIKEWRDGRLWCTRGWKSLCNINNIDKDDVCICEFVQEEDSEDVQIVVHVLDIAGKQGLG